MVKQLFQASDYSRRTCGKMLTSVNMLAVLQVRLVFGKAGLEIAGWAFLSCGFKQGSTPWACLALRRRKGCSNVTSKPPSQTPNIVLRQPRKELFVNFSDALRPWCVVWHCVFVTWCVMTVNESSATLNMTLAIYDIKLDGHRPHAAKC